jgi:hypothetical protein
MGIVFNYKMAGETNWEVNSEMVIRREYFSKIMQGIPYRHTDPFPLNHGTPPPVANTQNENVFEQIDPPIVTNATATSQLEPTVMVV